MAALAGARRPSVDAAPSLELTSFEGRLSRAPHMAPHAESRLVEQHVFAHVLEHGVIETTLGHVQAEGERVVNSLECLDAVLA